MLFLLLPGLAAQATMPREIMIELNSDVMPLPVPDGAGELDAGVPDSAGEVPQEPIEADEPGPDSEPVPQQAAPGLPAAAEATVTPPVATEQPVQPEQLPTVPVEKIDATDVDLSPAPIVEESPVKVDPPAEEPVKPVEEPKPEPPAEQPEDAVPEKPAEQPVEEPTEQPQEKPQEAPAADEPVKPSEEPAGAGGEAGDDPEEPGGQGEEEGPPPPPPGPSAAELRLLKGYGDAALKRIKGQARQPEAGGKGTVRFAFTIDKLGHLVDVRLVKTSGRTILDHDVMEATRAAFNDAWEIVPFPKGLSMEEYEFERSITYPLY